MASGNQSGDVSLLEQILYPFLRNRSSEELLADHDEEWGTSSPDGSKNFGDSKREGDANYDDFPLETLFVKDARSQTVDGFPSVDMSTQSDSICEGDDAETQTPISSSQRTRVYYYKMFMEQALSVKSSCSKALQVLEDGKVVLEEYHDIKNDPGVFERIHFTQAWVWILKESIVALLDGVEKHNGNKQSFALFLNQIVTDLEDGYRKLARDAQNLHKKFSIVEAEFTSLLGKAEERFINNAENARRYEMCSPGENFFHRYPKCSYMNDNVCKENTESSKHAPVSEKDSEKLPGKVQLLRVRCSVDGVILRSGQTSCPWLKLAQLSIDRDIKLVMNVFVAVMIEMCNAVREKIAAVNELLERSEKFIVWFSEEQKGCENSVIQPILKLTEILDLPRSTVNFFPREEVLMLFALKKSSTMFSLIKPTVHELLLSASKQLTMVRKLTRRKKYLSKGHVGDRFPKCLKSHAYFELLIKDTKINTDVILNRYYNLREARDLKDKIVQQLSFSPIVIAPSAFLVDHNSEEEPATFIYRGDAHISKFPSVPETLAVFQSSTEDICGSEIRDNTLLGDFEEDYLQLTKTLTTHRIITEEMLDLCSDPVQSFYRSVQEKSKCKEIMLSKIVLASQALAYAQSSTDSKALEKATPIGLWVHALCRLLYIWEYHPLPSHVKSQFRHTNDKTISWIRKLEECLKNLTDNVKQYKIEFKKFQELFEGNHGFCTWIRRNFEFPSPSEMVTQWLQDSTEDNTSVDEVIIESECQKQVELHFHDFDMTVVESNPEENANVELMSLNKVSPAVQTGIVTSFYALIDHIISTAIVHLNCVTSIQSKHINVKSLKQALFPQKSSEYLKYVHRLEDTVLALTFETALADIEDMMAHASLLHKFVLQVNQLFQTVQLHIEDKGMLQENEKDAKPVTQKRSELEMYDSHAKYVNETIQLLRSSVKTMPKVFVIRAESLTNSYLNWAKVAEMDANIVSTANVDPAEELASLATDTFIVDEPTQESEKEMLIDFQKAMMATITGKAFFPDPEPFTDNIEDWRGICFDMLAAAVNKFHDLTNEKIVETRKALNNPLICQSTCTGNDFLSHKIPKTVCYTEGISSVLCFLTGKLSPRDKLNVPTSQLKDLIEKLVSANSIIEKLKKTVDATERTLVNSLSLAVAKVEDKYLPKFLPVLPHDDDFLKSHDLEEIGPISPQEIEEKLGESREGRYFVEILWESIEKNKVFLKSHGQNDSESGWLEFSQLHVVGQLRIIYKLVDQLLLDAWKAIELIHEAKEDIIIAKRILLKTWEGLGKDLKLKRMPQSCIVVLLKLYRHQVATAVVSLKAIKKTIREVHYLVSQTVRKGRKWVSENLQASLRDSRMMKSDVYVMNMENLSIRILLDTLETELPWTIVGSKITAQDNVRDTIANASKVLDVGESAEVLDIRSVVQDKSSISIMTKFDEPETSETRLQRENFVESKVTVKGATDIFSLADDIQQTGLLALEEVATLFHFADSYVNSNSSETTNFNAVVTSLISVSTDIRVFKEVLPQQRHVLLKSITILQDKINQVRVPLDGVRSEVTKIKSEVETLDTCFRSMQDFSGEMLPMTELLGSSYLPVKWDSPTKFIQNVAESIEGHVWTLACGVPKIGTVIKNGKTLESHAVGNLPLSSKLEIFFSIVTYLDKILVHVHNVLDTSIREISFSRKSLKRKTRYFSQKGLKGILGFKKKRENAMLNSSEIDEHLICFARIFQATLKAEKECGVVYEMLAQANELLRRVYLYIDIKFKLEPPVGTPVVDKDTLRRARNWQIMDTITGMSNPPVTIPPPVILKKLARKNQRDEIYQNKYKAAWETKVLELELLFDRFCPRNQVSVEIPLAFSPTSSKDGSISIESEMYLKTTNS